MDIATLPAEVQSLTIEQNGASMPIHEHPVIKNTPDLPTAFKRLIEQDAEINRRVRPIGKDSKPEDIDGFFSKLEVRPPDKWLRKMRDVPEQASQYEYIKPEGIPDGLTWNEEAVGKARDLAHKLGWSKQDFTEALNFHNNFVADMLKQSQAAQDQAWGAFGTEEETKQALQKDWGADTEAKYAKADEGFQKLLADVPEVYDLLKLSPLARTPAFVKAMYQYGMATSEDSSGIGAPRVSKTVDDAIKEFHTPGTEKNKLWQSGNAEANREYQELYNKKYPGLTSLG